MKEKQWSGKLDDEWKGSYYIYGVLLKELYKIKGLNGRILRISVNEKWLKRYHSRKSRGSMVIIT